MKTKKYKIQQLQSDETLLTLHPETDASIVKVDTSKTGTTATNVEDALKELKDTIGTGSGGVTGVKGSAESSYRKGNVEITKANIGLSNVDNTSDADKPISTAVQAALDTVVQIAEGKTKTYVISASVNLSFASNEDTIKLSMQGTNITTTTGQTSIRLSELKLGDIVLLTDTDYPDRWVSTINGNLMWFDKLETRKIDLSGYATTSDLDSYLPLSGGAVTGDITMNIMKGIKHTDANVTSGFGFADDGWPVIVNTNARAINISNSTLDDYNAYTFPEYSGEVLVKDEHHNVKIKNDAGADAYLNLSADDTGLGPHPYMELYAYGNSTYYHNDNITQDTSDGVYKIRFPKKSGTIALTSNVTGSYSAVQVTNGIVTEGAQMFEVGVTNQTEPSDNLAVGGIFFQEI